MVKRVLLLIALSLFCSPLFAIFGLGTHYNEETIQESFTQLNDMTEEELNKFFEVYEIVLTPLTLEKITLTLDKAEQDLYLHNLLKDHYTASERQKLINDLLSPDDYKTLLLGLSPQECLTKQELANPQFFGTLPLIDLLKTSLLPRFFEPTLKTTLRNRGHFNAFNTFDQMEVSIEPFGSYTSYHHSPGFPHFDLTTIGLSLSGEYSLSEPVALGLGLAYSHSNIHWDNQEGDGSLNTLYFGPTLTYLFPYGYVSGTLLVATNFYHIERKTELFPEKKDKERSSASPFTWDLTPRIEGGLSLPLGLNLYLSPQITLDYMHIFALKGTETLDKETDLAINSLYESFLRWKGILQASYEHYQENMGILAPYIFMGWVHYDPLSQNGYKYRFKECKDSSYQKSTLKSMTQYTVGAGISFFHLRGIFLSLNYELYMGYNSPTHAGNMRLSWTY